MAGSWVGIAYRLAEQSASRVWGTSQHRRCRCRRFGLVLPIDASPAVDAAVDRAMPQSSATPSLPAPAAFGAAPRAARSARLGRDRRVASGGRCSPWRRGGPPRRAAPARVWRLLSPFPFLHPDGGLRRVHRAVSAGARERGRDRAVRAAFLRRAGAAAALHVRARSRPAGRRRRRRCSRACWWRGCTTGSGAPSRSS